VPHLNPLIERAQDVRVGSLLYREALSDPQSINLTAAESHHGPPPHGVEAYKRAIDAGRMHYGSMRGEPALRSAIADDLKERFGIQFDPQEEVLVTSGASGALLAAIWTFIGEGDEVITPDPTYSFIFEKTKLVGGTPKSVREQGSGGGDSVDEASAMLAEIESLVSERTKMIILCHPNNPTGTVYSEKCLREIGLLAERHDLVVLADQVYDQVVYDGNKLHSILEFPGMRERTILVNSFSKSYGMSGLRVGYAATSKEIMRHLFKIHANDNPHPSVPAQLAAAAALSGPREFLRDWIREFQENRDRLADGLNRIEGVRCGKPQGGLVAFPDLSTFGASEDVSTRLVKQAKVVVYPGTWYGRYGEGHVRACFASVEGKKLDEAVARARDVLLLEKGKEKELVG
jgi:aspartate aminotransferase